MQDVSMSRAANTMANPREFEAAILLECDSIQRTNLQGLDHQFLINIDHHVSGRPFAHLNWIDPSACATAEMIYRLARAANVPICPNVATCLYTAVLTDTGSFGYVGTCERTFALAQELVRAGADPMETLTFTVSVATSITW